MLCLLDELWSPDCHVQSQLHTKTKALTRLQLVTENQMNIRDFFHVRRQTLVSQILLLTWKFQVMPLHQVLPTQPVLMKLMSSITCFEAATEWKMYKSKLTLKKEWEKKYPSHLYRFHVLWDMSEVGKSFS